MEASAPRTSGRRQRRDPSVADGRPLPFADQQAPIDPLMLDRVAKLSQEPRGVDVVSARRSQARPTLLPEPIAVAQEPIPCEVLQDLLGYTPHKLNGLLERSKLLLNSSSSGRETSSAANNKMTYESVYLVHKMMYEWLIGECGEYINRDLTVDEDEGHTMLASWCMENREHQFSVRYGVYHLCKAGKTRIAKEWVCSLGWLLGRVSCESSGGSIAAAKDAELAGEQLIASVLRLQANAAGNDPRQLVGQIIGRMSLSEDPVALALLREAEDWRLANWWKPVTHSLLQAGGSLRRVLQAGAKVHSVAWSLDASSRLATGLDDHTIGIWTQSGDFLQVLEGHTAKVKSVAFSTDGNVLASGANDSTVVLWQTHSGDCIQTLNESQEYHSGPIKSVAFSPNGELLASGSEDKTVRLWTSHLGWMTGNCECIQVLEGHTNWVYSVAFSQDSKLLASGSLDTTARVWDVQNGECTQTLEGHSKEVWAVAFSPVDRQMLATCSKDCTARVWRANNQEWSCVSVLEGHSHPVNSIAFSPDGQQLATGASDQTARTWVAESGKCVQVLEGHSGWVLSVAFSPDGHTLATASWDSTARLWEPKSNVHKKVVPTGHTYRILTVAWSPDKSTLATGSWDKTARLWLVETGQCVQVLKGHLGAVRVLAWSPDGHTLATGSDLGTTRIWTVETGVCIHVLNSHTGEAEQKAAVASLAKTARQAAIEAKAPHSTAAAAEAAAEAKAVHTAAAEASKVVLVEWSPDGIALVTGTGDGTAQLWATGTGELSQRLQEHQLPEWATGSTKDSNGISSKPDENPTLKPKELCSAAWTINDDVGFTSDSLIHCVDVIGDRAFVTEGNKLHILHRQHPDRQRCTGTAGNAAPYQLTDSPSDYTNHGTKPRILLSYRSEVETFKVESGTSLANFCSIPLMVMVMVSRESCRLS